MPDTRTAHPYFMYDAIQAQPDAFTASLRANPNQLEMIAEHVAESTRLFLVGIGTSYHAAQIGEFLLRAYAPQIDTRAIHAFDFALYGPRLDSHDAVLVVSHRGNKRFSVEALKRAFDAGCFTALITVPSGTADTTNVEVSLRAAANERSSAHTISYVTALALLAGLTQRLSASQSGGVTLAENVLLETLPAVLRDGLQREAQMDALARRFVGRRRIWLAGSGPSGVTAQEIALKIKETSYLQAEGMSTETMLHGPFQATDADDLFVLIAPEGPGQERTQTLLAQSQAIGAAALVVSDGTLVVESGPSPVSSCAL